MKKLLLGSMLVLGATSFATSVQDLANNSTTPAALQINVRGEVIDTTKYTLVLKPVNTSGTTTDSLEFKFDDLVVGKSATLKGEFEAGVYQNDTSVDLGANHTLEANLKKAGNNITNGQVHSGDKVDLAYTLGELMKRGNVYRGNVSVEAKGNKVGSFVENGVTLEVLVK